MRPTNLRFDQKTSKPWRVLLAATSYASTPYNSPYLQILLSSQVRQQSCHSQSIDIPGISVTAEFDSVAGEHEVSQPDPTPSTL